MAKLDLNEALIELRGSVTKPQQVVGQSCDGGASGGWRQNGHTESESVKQGDLPEPRESRAGVRGSV
jgi:hypothetical protein